MELALVTVAGDYRPALVYDLTDGTRFRRRRGTTRLMADPDNDSKATISGTWVIHAQDGTELPSLIDTLVRRITRPGRYEHVEWKTPPAERAVYLPRTGPGTAQVVTSAYQHALYRRAVVELSMPVEYPPRGLCMDVRDDFDVDSRSDFTFDTMTSADVTVAGDLAPVGTLTTERRARHTARGYQVLEGEATIKLLAGAATNPGLKVGRTLRASASNTYVEVYVDDDGVNSRLRIDVVIAGVRTNRASVNLAARIASGTSHYVRGRIEGNTVYAEHFINPVPTPMGAPATQAPAGGGGYALTGGEIASLVPGYLGFTWIPQHANARLDDYTDRPFTWRNRTLPERLQPSTDIPGSAPALADLEVTPSGGANPPRWALLAWNRRPTTPLAGAVVPFGILQAEAAGDLAGWAVAGAASALGGSMLSDATPTSGETYTASWTVDPATLDPDELHAREIQLEVWGRVALSASLVTPKLTLSARPEAGLDYGPQRFTREHGSAGQLVVVPAGAGIWRALRLGTLVIPFDPKEPVKWKLWLAGSLGAGSAGADWGVDYLWVVSADRRVCSPVGLPLDSAYPLFVKSVNQTTKRVGANGQGMVSSPPGPFFPDIGLGGSRIELSPGQVDLFAKLSSLPPNDPTAGSASSEQTTHAATVHARVTPRYVQMR